VVAFQRKKPAAIGTKANYPGFIEPALASSIERVPGGARWLHEIKFDGYRVQVHLANERIRVFTRRGHDWTKRFKKIADDAWHIGAASAIIDGEVVVPSTDGATDFSVLQNELKGRSIGRLRPALPERLRSAKTAAVRTQGGAQEADYRHRYPVQRVLRSVQMANLNEGMQEPSFYLAFIRRTVEKMRPPGVLH
jgi:hypothetical protein